MDFNVNQPIYLQIIDDIVAKVLRGEIKMGEKLPSVRELSKKYQVNPNTIQRVIRELEHNNLIDIKRGTGSFIVDNKEMFDYKRSEILKRKVEDFVGSLNDIGLSIEDMISFLENMKDGES